MVGETCGAPTGIVAHWITDIHNYQILPWYKRLFKKTPKYGNYQFEFVESDECQGWVRQVQEGEAR